MQDFQFMISNQFSAKPFAVRNGIKETTSPLVFVTSAITHWVLPGISFLALRVIVCLFLIDLYLQ